MQSTLVLASSHGQKQRQGQMMKRRQRQRHTVAWRLSYRQAHRGTQQRKSTCTHTFCAHDENAADR